MGMLPLKVLLLSTGVVSMAVILKLSLPVILAFLTSDLPFLWSIALSWLQPLYLYLLINCIIISIVASSKLQPRGGADIDAALTLTSKLTQPEKVPDAAVVKEVDESDDVLVFGYVESSPVVVKAGGYHHIVTPPVKEERENGGGDEEEEEFVLSKVSWNSPEIEYSPVVSDDKPSFSSRFSHRRGVKASPEGKAKLRVTKPKKQDTLESTWRTITEGRPMPLTRHIRKSDTLGGASMESSPSPVKVMKKSDTFTTGGNSSPAMSSGRLRREPSLSQDELNRRVEAFIKKFNEEMRLQRHESLNQYNEMMVGRGSH